LQERRLTELSQVNSDLCGLLLVCWTLCETNWQQSWSAIGLFVAYRGYKGKTSYLL